MFAVRKFRGRTYICEHMLCANLESFSMAEGRFVYHLLTAPNKIGVLLHSVLNTKQDFLQSRWYHIKTFVFFCLSFFCLLFLSFSASGRPSTPLAPSHPSTLLPPSLSSSSTGSFLLEGKLLQPTLHSYLSPFPSLKEGEWSENEQQLHLGWQLPGFSAAAALSLPSADQGWGNVWEENIRLVTSLNSFLLWATWLWKL